MQVRALCAVGLLPAPCGAALGHHRDPPPPSPHAGTCAQPWAAAAGAAAGASSCSTSARASDVPLHQPPALNRSYWAQLLQRQAFGTQAPPPAAAGGKRKGKAATAAADAGASPATAAPVPSVDALKADYQRSRLQDLYSQSLSRELMLKLNLKSLDDLPKLRHVVVAIQAKDVTGQQHVDKWQMLLHALGLEYMSGQPARFVTSGLKYYRKRNAVTGE